MRYLLIALLLVVNTAARAADAEIPIDTPWKRAVYDFSSQKLQHSAWGLAHCKRDYLVSVELAKADGINADRDVLFAAAFLHDMGGFPEFAKPGVDHAARSAEICDTVLIPAGFPEKKIAAVRSAISTHSYYCPTPPATPEAIVLHDADTLDFLGMVSIARILSITERDAAAKDLAGAVKTLEALLAGAPNSLVGRTAKAIGEARAAEMRDALARLKAETFGGKAL